MGGVGVRPVRRGGERDDRHCRCVHGRLGERQGSRWSRLEVGVEGHGPVDAVEDLCPEERAVVGDGVGCPGLAAPDPQRRRRVVDRPSRPGHGAAQLCPGRTVGRGVESHDPSGRHPRHPKPPGRVVAERPCGLSGSHGYLGRPVRRHHEDGDTEVGQLQGVRPESPTRGVRLRKQVLMTTRLPGDAPRELDPQVDVAGDREGNRVGSGGVGGTGGATSGTRPVRRAAVEARAGEAGGRRHPVVRLRDGERDVGVVAAVTEPGAGPRNRGPTSGEVHEGDVGERRRVRYLERSALKPPASAERRERVVRLALHRQVRDPPRPSVRPGAPLGRRVAGRPGVPARGHTADDQVGDLRGPTGPAVRQATDRGEAGRERREGDDVVPLAPVPREPSPDPHDVDRGGAGVDVEASRTRYPRPAPHRRGAELQDTPCRRVVEGDGGPRVQVGPEVIAVRVQLPESVQGDVGGGGSGPRLQRVGLTPVAVHVDAGEELARRRDVTDVDAGLPKREPSVPGPVGHRLRRRQDEPRVRDVHATDLHVEVRVVHVERAGEPQAVERTTVHCGTGRPRDGHRTRVGVEVRLSYECGGRGTTNAPRGLRPCPE